MNSNFSEGFLKILISRIGGFIIYLAKFLFVAGLEMFEFINYANRAAMSWRFSWFQGLKAEVSLKLSITGSIFSNNMQIFVCCFTKMNLASNITQIFRRCFNMFYKMHVSRGNWDIKKCIFGLIATWHIEEKKPSKKL